MRINGGLKKKKIYGKIMKIVLTKERFLTKPIHIPFCYYCLQRIYSVMHSVLQVRIFISGKAKTKQKPEPQML